VKGGRRIVATSSFGQIVVLDDDMADRIIESNKTANDYPFGEPTGFFKHGTKEDAKRLVERMKRAAK
jgi:HEPN domain-containing protein